MTAQDLERKGFVLIDGNYVKPPKKWKPKNEISDSGLRAYDPKPTQGNSLECAPSRKGQSGASVISRTRIRFDVYSVRPADYDGYSIKELQDMLIKAGCLFDDKWDCLEGTVVSHKAHTKAEERTVIEITEP